MAALKGKWQKLDPLRLKREARARDRARVAANNRALVGFTPDGQAVVNPVQAELRRLFKGIVSRPAAARLEGIRNRNPSTHEAVEATTVHVAQANHLCTEEGREARRVRLAERDKRAAEYRVGLTRKVAEMAAREATEASVDAAPAESKGGH